MTNGLQTNIQKTSFFATDCFALLLLPWIDIGLVTGPNMWPLLNQGVINSQWLDIKLFHSCRLYFGTILRTSFLYNCTGYYTNISDLMDQNTNHFIFYLYFLIFVLYEQSVLLLPVFQGSLVELLRYDCK